MRPIEAWRAIRRGGLEELSGIEATAEPVTVTSASADLHADPWEFVFTHTPAGPWRSRALQGRSIRAVLRLDDARVVITSEGDVVAFDADGASRPLIDRSQLAAAVDVPGRLVIRGADALRSRLALVVGTYESLREGLRWLTTAIVVRDGHSSELEVVHLRSAQDREGEVLDVAIAR